MDCSLLGSSIHGILQATVLEWGAIAFSEKRAEASLRYPDGPEEASSLTVNFPRGMDLWPWQELECGL